MMKFSLNKGIAGVFGLLLLGSSCGDTDLFDTDKWSDTIEGWEPALKAKIAHGEFSMWDLLKDTANDAPIQCEPEPGTMDSILVVRYAEPDIYTLENLSEIFTLALEPVAINLPGVNIPGDIDVNLPADMALEAVTAESGEVQGIPAGCVLREIMFDGNLNLTLPRLPACNYEILIQIDNIYENANDGGPFSKVIHVTQGVGSQSESIDLSSALMKFSPDDLQISLSATVTLKAGGTVTAGGSLGGIAVKVSQIVFVKAMGKIVIDPMTVDGHFNMDVDFLNELGGAFKFADPQLKLVVENKGIGVKTDLKMSFWVNEGVGKDRFDGENLFLSGNKLNNESVKEEVIYKGSALADFLSLPPKGDIKYNGSVSSVVTDENDVIWRDGSINISAEVYIPLSLSATGLTYCDTIEDVEVESDIADKIKSGRIVIIAENGLPLNLKVNKLQLVDENYSSAGLSAVVGGQELKASGKSTIKLELSPENIRDLSKMKHILMEVGASTDGVATIRTSNRLKFSLAIEVKANITDTNF